MRERRHAEGRTFRGLCRARLLGLQRQLQMRALRFTKVRRLKLQVVRCEGV